MRINAGSSFTAALVACLLYSILFLCSDSFAQRKLGLKAGLEVGGKYEWNPSLLSDKEQESSELARESYVTHLIAVLSGRYSVDYGEFRLNYKPSFDFYRAQGISRRAANSHVGQFWGRLNFTDSLSLTVDDRFTDSVVGSLRMSDDSNLGRRYTGNICTARIQYSPGTRVVLSISHRTSGLWNRGEDDKQLDRDSNFALASAGYRLGSRTEVGVLGDWGLISGKAPGALDDRYEYSGSIYLSRYFAGMDVKVRANGGFVSTRYRSRGAEKAPERRTGFSGSFSASKRLSEGSYAHIILRTGYEPSDVWAGEFRRSSSVRGSFQHTFLKRIETILNGEYQHRKYVPTNDRKDHVYRTSTILGYKLFRWLSIRANYTFACVDSTFEEYEYDSHAVGVSFYAEYGSQGDDVADYPLELQEEVGL